MISLRRFHSGEQVAINPDLIERIEQNPDTVVTMTNGNRYVIEENIDEITDKIRLFRASLLTLAMHMAEHPTGAGNARLRVLKGEADGGQTFESGVVEP
jgi:flagellar protein FlbD